MGSSSTKFRKHLQGGDEVQALQLYRTNSELRKALEPNCSYGDSHNHETPLHLASKFAMQMLLGIFLFSKFGNPNKTNARKETCLHCVCKDTSNWQSVHTQKRRADCLSYLLKWRGTKLAEGQLEKIDLAAQDEKLNTALHYAAASGLAQCVETLIQQGAPLFVENEDQLTPCDAAERNGHADIALYLESKMVFSNDEEQPEEEDDVSMPPMEEYSGLRPQDLQEAKDMLLVETADMLSVPLFTAEALLRNHEWSRETLLEAWMMDPVACCEKCGVTPPASLFSDKPEVQENLASPLPSPQHAVPVALDAECDICANTFLLAEEPVHMTCAHTFCKDCWERYLNVKIQEGDAHHITCPAYDCCLLVPVDMIEAVVSRDMARRYLQFDIKAFVDSNPDMKWCPFPRCGRAVKLPELDTGQNRASGQRFRIPSDTSRGVDCGGGHYFCWECLEESHEPCSCANWTTWFSKIADVKPETLHDTDQETELAANCLWLVTNSKPCPNCKSPIQKNEGCNHMKCSKCKYDFCWVCLEQWKRHNSSTGGYFMCNRFEVVKKVEEQNAQQMTDAEVKNKTMQELNRFVHYYSRFKNHENSFKLEEPLLKTAKDKMMKLAEAVTDSATAQSETRFVEEAVQQLLKARRVLKCSYVYGYYLDGPGYKKIVFEFMQTELEECTEILSQMVNRLYLRTPRRKIIEQAHVVQRKRQEFIMAISKGLVPAETPPSVRRKKKKKKKAAGEGVDEDLHRAIVASIQEVDPANPWIKDASGKHTNVVALLDWPSEDSDESDNDEQKEKKASIGKCQRVGCPKLKAKNPRTQEAHDFCSRWCMLADKQEKADNEEEDREEGVTDVVLDEHMELLRALEMSRLQYLQESGLLHVPDSTQLLSSTTTTTTQPKHKHRPRSNSAGQDAKTTRPAVSAMEDFDLELQRFQELSAGFPKGERTNFLYDPMNPSEDKTNQAAGFCRKSMGQTSRFDENKSTIVTRVPNKSVEDLYCLDMNTKPSSKQVQHQHQQYSIPYTTTPTTTTATSPGSPVLGSSSSNSSPVPAVRALTADRLTTTLPASPPDILAFTTTPSAMAAAATAGNRDNNNKDKQTNSGSGTTFGAIKDLSVSNIHSSESDKTKDFSSKDIASLFSSIDFDAGFREDLENYTSHGLHQTTTMMMSSGWPEADIKLALELQVSSCKSRDLDRDSYAASRQKGSGSGRSGMPAVVGKGRSGSGSKQGLTKSGGGKGKGKWSSSSGGGDSGGKTAVFVVGGGGGGKEGRETGLMVEEEVERGLGGYGKQGSSPRSSLYAEAKEEEEGNKSSKKKGGEAAIRRSEEEVSLLKMAENLVQMTADVHLRMKEVEKGIRDLDSRSKLESLKKRSSGGDSSLPSSSVSELKLLEQPVVVVGNRPDSADLNPVSADKHSKCPPKAKVAGSSGGGVTSDPDGGESRPLVETVEDQWYDVVDTMMGVGGGSDGVREGTDPQTSSSTFTADEALQQQEHPASPSIPSNTSLRPIDDVGDNNDDLCLYETDCLPPSLTETETETETDSASCYNDTENDEKNDDIDESVKSAEDNIISLSALPLSPTSCSSSTSASSYSSHNSSCKDKNTTRVAAGGGEEISPSISIPESVVCPSMSLGSGDTGVVCKEEEEEVELENAGNSSHSAKDLVQSGGDADVHPSTTTTTTMMMEKLDFSSDYSVQGITTATAIAEGKGRATSVSGGGDKVEGGEEGEERRREGGGAGAAGVVRGRDKAQGGKSKSKSKKEKEGGGGGKTMLEEFEDFLDSVYV